MRGIVTYYHQQDDWFAISINIFFKKNDYHGFNNPRKLNQAGYFFATVPAGITSVVSELCAISANHGRVPVSTVIACEHPRIGA